MSQIASRLTPAPKTSSSGLITTLTTHRLVLRLIDPESPEQLQHMLDTYNSPFVNPRQPNGPMKAETLKQKLKDQAPSTQPHLCTKVTNPPSVPTHLIYFKSPNIPFREEIYIGFVSLSFRPSAPYPDLGFAFLEVWTGRGLATEACKLALGFWRDEVGVREIAIGTDPGNVRARRMAGKLGFVEGGGYQIDVGKGEVREGVQYLLPGMEGRGDVVIGEGE